MDDANDSEEGLVKRAAQTLRSLLGPDWQVADMTPGDAQASRSFFDARLQITPPDRSRYTDVLVSAYRSLTPRAVERNVGPIHEILGETSNPPVLLVVAPWLSQRTQNELRTRGIGYLDLTGNVDWSVGAPAIRILTQGASKAPKANGGEETKSVTLAGPRAGRVIRFLTDFQPPYRATQIADEAGTSLPWVSRLLGQLEDQLLVSRDGRSIVKTDWEGLLRARAETYSLLRHNSFVGMTSPHGPQAVLRDLRELMNSKASQNGDRSIAVTGPLASRAIAPLTAGGQLMLYVQAGPRSPDIWADELGLLRTEDDADVLFLRAYDDIVFSRTRQVDGIPHVALTQLVLDGLGGPGRMPAEAEAILQHMAMDTDHWRMSWNKDARG
ncbi:helix-turn-helix domain-containing protein [Amycolatopsis sp. NPDC048633]|uniref:helix-turn-helix domain-containing protein n=1 Tax=Amycolatopsis sp. NPDC048633 TaxID=3157095 RepID=UPI0033F97CA2